MTHHLVSAWRAVRRRTDYSSFNTDQTDRTDLNPLNFLNPLNLYLCHKTKTSKTPCARCKMSLTSHRCCARLKILKQAWIFSASPTITPPGSCIHRKAINKDKPSLSSGVLPSRQQSRVCRLPGTPPPSVYQVTHGTALQAAECNVMLHVLVLPSRQQSAM